MTVTQPAPTPEVLFEWIRARVAYYIERDPDDIDPDTKLVGYGLDSVYALAICGDLEDEFGLVVDATLAWDYPTVNAIVDYLSEVVTASPAP